MKKRTFKKSVAMLFALLLFITPVLTACGSKDNSGNNNSNGEEGVVLDVSVGPEPETLDPNKNTAADAATYITHVFEGLMRLDSENNIVEAAAESYEVSEDGLVYTFTLRDNAKWSDGTPLKAEDFVYSWQRLVDPMTASDYNYIIDMVKNANEIMAGELDKSELGIKALDEKTVEVTLNVATPYFLEICAFPSTFPLREDVVEANTDTWYQDASTYIGNGGYVLKEWNHQSNIVLVKNENYHDVESLGPDTINFQLMEDKNTILSSFENGEILFGDDLPSEEIGRMTDNGLYIKEQLGTYFYVFNLDNEALKDVRIRKALSLAVDRNYLVESVAKGGQIPADTYVPTGLNDVDTTTEFHDVANKWYSVDKADYEANVKEAKKLLAEAGYPDGKGLGTIELMVNPGHESMAEAIIYMWQNELGVNATISQQDWAVFIETRNSGEYQVARHGWLGDYNDPISFLDMWVTGGGNNDANYSNKEYDKLIAKIKVTSDKEERMSLMHQAEDILAEDMPVLPLYFYTDLYLKADKLEGFYSSPLGFKNFMYTTIVE